MLSSFAPVHAKERITVTAIDSRPLSSKPANCEIQEIQDPTATPTRPYVEFAIINYHDERHRSKDGALKLHVVMPKIKARACNLGADALVNIRVTEIRRLEFVMYNVRATALRFRAGQSSPPRHPPIETAWNSEPEQNAR
jgi:hypothetical protein